MSGPAITMRFKKWLRTATYEAARPDGHKVVLPMPVVRVHDLRHTWISLQMRSNPVVEVSRAAGHTRTSTTTDTYGHPSAAGQRRLAETLPEVFGS